VKYAYKRGSIPDDVAHKVIIRAGIIMKEEDRILFRKNDKIFHYPFLID